MQIAYVPCPSGKQRRYASFLNVLDIFKVGWGFIIALVRLYQIYPDAIITKGGYTSVPVVLAAALLKIPIVVHESDTRPGKANALAARFARTIAISFEEVRPYFKHPSVHLTGIPLREELLAPPSPHPHATLGLDVNTPIILFLGGSQGAERLNELLLQSLSALLTKYTIVHQTGKKHFDLTVLSARELITNDTLLARYHPLPYVEDPRTLNDLYHVASLVVSRAGSTTIYEIAHHGKPSLLIPIPETISHDQRTNAYAYAGKGAALVLEETNLTSNLLSSEIDRIMSNPILLTEMALRSEAFGALNGSAAVAEMALQIAGEHT
jgi:UDP-N-acetylglucosamine--N-acetylmuramyl-(pentapeptide) pyrophosphoryl-undecaprenol N-acetylglucosamine transferase